MSSEDKPTRYQNFYYEVKFDQEKSVVYGAILFDHRHYPSPSQREVRVYEKKVKSASEAAAHKQHAEGEVKIAIGRIANHSLFQEITEKAPGSQELVGIVEVVLPVPEMATIRFSLGNMCGDDRSLAMEDAAFCTRQLQNIWFGRKKI